MTSQKERPVTAHAPQLWGRVLSVSVFLLVPTLYVFGKSYWDGWLNQYGLSQTTFPLSVDEAIFKSYEGVLWLGVTTLPLIARVSLLLTGLVALWVACALILEVWTWIKPRLKEHLIGPVGSIIKFTNRHQAKFVAAATSYQIAAMPFLVLGFAFSAFLLLLVPLMLGYYIGSWQGERSYAELRGRIAAGKIDEGEQLLVTTSREGLRLITCGDIGCAGASVKGTEFIRWDRIDRIVQLEKKFQLSSKASLKDNP